MGIMYGGNGELLGFQTLAVFIMVVWAAFFTWITMLIIKSITGLDVDPDQEKIGLDITVRLLRLVSACAGVDVLVLVHWRVVACMCWCVLACVCWWCVLACVICLVCLVLNSCGVA